MSILTRQEKGIKIAAYVVLSLMCIMAVTPF